MLSKGFGGFRFTNAGIYNINISNSINTLILSK